MNRNVPWGVLNISKLVLTGALILLTIVDLCMAARYNSQGIIFRVDFYTPLIKIVTFVSSFTKRIFDRLTFVEWMTH